MDKYVYFKLCHVLKTLYSSADNTPNEGGRGEMGPAAVRSLESDSAAPARPAAWLKFIEPPTEGPTTILLPVDF